MTVYLWLWKKGVLTMSKKPHALKGRKLSPEAMAARMVKFKATMAARKLAKQSDTPIPTDTADLIKDAVVYLQHANRAMNRKAVGKLLPTELLYVQLAIRTLLGDI
jgi:hypothetical protein